MTPHQPGDPDGPPEQPWRRGVWDPGLQVERTKLAWQRTALSTVACTLVIARLVWTTHPVLGVIVAAAALGCGGMVGWTASHRDLRARMAIHRDERLPVGARLQLWLTALLVVAGVGAVISAITLTRI